MIGITSARLASRLVSLEALLPTIYVLSAILVAEFAEYWVQRLLHVARIPSPGKGELMHRAETYPRDSVLRFRDAPLLKPWFRTARRLHDIHHRSSRNAVTADTHSGVGFFPFGCMFCTIRKLRRPRLEPGQRAARKGLTRQTLAGDDTQFPSQFRL
jgi:sterol desaturase/sphingolipid hydroxylase (fatty acid hydroxylase superfamily)